MCWKYIWGAEKYDRTSIGGRGCASRQERSERCDLSSKIRITVGSVIPGIKYYVSYTCFTKMVLCPVRDIIEAKRCPDILFAIDLDN